MGPTHAQAGGNAELRGARQDEARAELRKVLPRHGIVTVGSGHPQSSTKQDFPVYEPRTHITPGSYSPMGFALPAAIGAKLAKRDTPVVCIIGDGDFMMCVQELATCVAYQIPVVFLVLNNADALLPFRLGENTAVILHPATAATAATKPR